MKTNPLTHIICDAQTLFVFSSYSITITPTAIVAALLIYGAEGFGDLTDFIEDLVPLPSIQDILGLDNDFLDTVTSLVRDLYQLIQDGVELVVDSVLFFFIGDDSELINAARTQFAGCAITMIFVVCKHTHVRTSFH